MRTSVRLDVLLSDELIEKAKRIVAGQNEHETEDINKWTWRSWLEIVAQIAIHDRVDRETARLEKEVADA